MPRRRRPNASTTVKAALCVTCLVDIYYPQVGEAVVEVLRRLGVDIRFPLDQTCCGLAAYEGGFVDEATLAARHFIEVFNGDDAVVVPSPACAAMVKVRYPALFKEDADQLIVAQQLGERIREFTDFVVNSLETVDIDAYFNGKITYHDACHALHDLGISQAPRMLLDRIRSAQIVEMTKCEVCCGFGGQLPDRQPHITEAMMEQKLNAIETSGADVVASNDMGCVTFLNAALKRRNIQIKAMHVAELLVREE